MIGVIKGEAGSSDYSSHEGLWHYLTGCLE